MKNLYIIGNGFDLYHKLDTKYQTFAKYLANNYSDIYELLLTYYYLPDLTNMNVSKEDYDSWSEFEIALANLDYESILEDNSDYAANPNAEDFRDRDWHSYQFEMEFIVDKLTEKLKEAFRKFILEVDYNQDLDDILINIENDYFFLSFNYTEPLQKFYEIPEDKILYIHNKASKENTHIILGHGTDPKEFEITEEKKIPPTNLTEEELEYWQEEMNDQNDYSYESAKSEILGYYLHSFKNTTEIIANHSTFFSTLNTVENVYVLGHSISEVDIKYFEEIFKNLEKSVKWSVTYNREETKQSRQNTLLNLGISEENLKLIKIESLKEK